MNSNDRLRAALTGGSSGIGAMVAKRLKTEGFEVCVFDIEEPKSNADHWIKLDLEDSSSVDAAIAESTGPYDALINNAGLPPREGWAEKILKVNYLGFQRFLSGMLEQLNPGASIVNTASRAGAMWQDNLGQVKKLMTIDSTNHIARFVDEENIDHVRAYNLSKEAMIVYTLSQTENLLSRDLRMNCVSPSAVSTSILEDFKTAFGERAIKNIARAKRPAEPEEVANTIVFLAKTESNWIKGIDLIVDGGMGAMAATDQLGLKELN